jgi:membrane protease YdiL (CAAX protease family)
MEGHEPSFRAPTEAVPSSETGDPTPDHAETSLDHPGRRSDAGFSRRRHAPWTGGRIALIVAAIGLFGAALGGGWLGLQAGLGLSQDAISDTLLLLVAAALLAGGLALMVGGLGYYVLAPGFMGPRMAWQDVGSHRLVIATTILIVLLANAGPLAYASIAGARGLCSIPGFLTAALSVDFVLLGVTYLRFIRPGVLTTADLGVDRSKFVHHVGLGVLTGVGVLVLSAIIQTVLQAAGVRQTQLMDLQCVREFPLAGFMAVVVAGGVLAPLAEELYFRGYVFRSYLPTRGPLVAYGATSLLFATLHLNLPALLPILVLSLIFCFAYHRTGSIVPSVIGHAVNNSAAFCILYFTNAPL